MTRYTLALHPLCPTSRELVKGLAREGLLGRVEIEVLDAPRPTGRRFYPWSVPTLLSPEGEPLAIDPLSPEEAAQIIRGEWSGPSRGDEEQLAWSVVYSAYASSIALTHHGLEPMLEPSFLSPGLRLPLRGESPEGAAGRLRGSLPGIYEEWRERIARALSIAVVRHLWYGGATLEDLESVTEPVVAGIVLSMASVGRAYLPLRPRKPDMAGFMAGFIRRRARGLLGKVEREYREITGDEEYWRLLGLRPGA